MKLKTLLGLSLSLFALTAFADNTDAIKTVLNHTTPTADTSVVLNEIKTLSVDVKKAEFPKNDAALKNLDGQTADAVKNKNFAQAYKKALTTLPKNVRKDNAWVNKLENATTMPTEYFIAPEGDFIGLSACKPHACPTNLKLLFNPKTKQVWGLLHVDETKQSYYIGKPSAKQIALLMIVMGDDVSMY